MEEVKDLKCPKCKSYKYSSQFLKLGRVLKTCNDCRQRDKIYRSSIKCTHGREKYRCNDCNGNGICEHDRRKS